MTLLIPAVFPAILTVFLIEISNAASITPSGIQNPSSTAGDGFGIVEVGELSVTKGIRASATSAGATPTVSTGLHSEAFFGTVNRTFASNTSDEITIYLNETESTAVSIITNDTAAIDTTNQTLSDLVNKGRWLLGADPRLFPKDSARFGNFHLYNCGPSGQGADPYSEQIRRTITRMSLNLVDVLYDVERHGARSRYGFDALFTSSRETHQVAAIFEKILVGEAVSLQPFAIESGAMTEPNDKPNRVRLYCFRPDVMDDVSQFGYRKCEENPGWVGFWMAGSSSIGLCPLFFNNIQTSPTSEDCPSFSSSGSLLSNFQTRLTANREAILIHELAHLYIGHDSNEAEAQTLQESMDLTVADQVKNAANYAYFYSCK